MAVRVEIVFGTDNLLFRPRTGERLLRVQKSSFARTSCLTCYPDLRALDHCNRLSCRLVTLPLPDIWSSTGFPTAFSNLSLKMIIPIRCFSCGKASPLQALSYTHES